MKKLALVRPPGQSSSDARLTDDDVDRIARRVAEVLAEQPTIGARRARRIAAGDVRDADDAMIAALGLRRGGTR